MPLAFLFSGGISWRLIGFVASIAFLTVAYFGINYIGRLENQIGELSRIANENAELAKNEREAARRMNAVAAQVAAEAEAARKAFSRRRTEIAHAAPVDDGPLAPVLMRTLNGLPKRDGDETRNDAVPADAGESARMSGRP